MPATGCSTSTPLPFPRARIVYKPTTRSPRSISSGSLAWNPSQALRKRDQASPIASTPRYVPRSGKTSTPMTNSTSGSAHATELQLPRRHPSNSDCASARFAEGICELSPVRSMSEQSCASHLSGGLRVPGASLRSDAEVGECVVAVVVDGDADHCTTADLEKDRAPRPHAP